MRLSIATILNLILPGSGLIVARQEWLGFLLAMLFTVSGQTAVYSLLIAPLAVSAELSAVAAGITVATWLSAQLLLIKRIRTLSDPSLSCQVKTCHDLAEKAWTQGRHDDAYGALCVALTVDDENPETYVKMARLTTLLGKYEQARRAWQKVEQLDRLQVFRREMVQALDRLPFKGTKNDA